MAGKQLKFRREIIDPDPPGAEHDILLIFDVNGDGRNDIVIGGKKGLANLFWYENPGWERREISRAPQLEAGGAVLDIAGNGRNDIVAGQQIGHKELYWFECPADPRNPWPERVIENRFEKYHDQAVGDVDGDGKPEIIAFSQKNGLLFYYDIPSDPRREPWPQQCFHIIADDVHNMEGLAICDINMDGRMEVIGGTRIYYPPASQGRWRSESYASGFVMTRIAVGDFDDDGRLEIIVCEGESHPGRLAYCRPPDFEPCIIRDDLFHPHSLAVADFDGDGRIDFMIAEMGLGRNSNPRMFVYRNIGGGRFEENLICEGIPTHEAKAADLTGNGLPDIVGKPYHPERHIDVWFNET